MLTRLVVKGTVIVGGGAGAFQAIESLREVGIITVSNLECVLMVRIERIQIPYHHRF